MTTNAFDGPIPQFYEQGLGPLLFHCSAEELAGCVEARPGRRVLETACGTGIATEALRKGLSEEVGIVATDLHEPMLEVATSPRGSLPGVEVQVADAQPAASDLRHGAAVGASARRPSGDGLRDEILGRRPVWRPWARPSEASDWTFGLRGRIHQACLLVRAASSPGWDSPWRRS